MKKFLSFLSSNTIIRVSFFASFFINIFAIISLALKFSSLPPKVPFFYSRPWGDEQLGSPFLLFILPGGAMCVLLINTILSMKFISHDILLARVTSAGCFIVSIISFIGLFKIILLVG